MEYQVISKIFNQLTDVLHFFQVVIVVFQRGKVIFSLIESMHHESKFIRKQPSRKSTR